MFLSCIVLGLEIPVTVGGSRTIALMHGKMASKVRYAPQGALEKVDLGEEEID